MVLKKLFLIPIFIFLYCPLMGTNSIDEVKNSSIRRLSSYSFDSGAPFISRIKKAPGFVLKYLKALASNRSYLPYYPEEKELELIQNAFLELPPLNKKIIMEKVAGIYFVSNLLGSGMADWLMDDKNNVYCTLYFNPFVLKMSLSQWLTYKENTCFLTAGSNWSLQIDAGKEYSGMFGILLHESTHCADYVENICPFVEDIIFKIRKEKPRETPFIVNIWLSNNLPIPAYDFTMRKMITFYGFHGGPKIKMSNAPELYQELSGTPFVSLYGSRYWIEDLAETELFYHLTQVLKQPYRIIVMKDGKTVFTYEPFLNGLVRSRFEALKVFYQ